MHMRLWNAADGKEICFFKGNLQLLFHMILNMYFGVYMDIYTLYVAIVIGIMSWHNYICGGMYVQCMFSRSFGLDGFGFASLLFHKSIS